MILKNDSNPIVISVVIVGVLISSWSGWLIYKEEEKAIIYAFQKGVNDRAASIYREMAINFEALRILVVMFDGEIVPDSNKFRFAAQNISETK
jgi:hypothetical protein